MHDARLGQQSGVIAEGWRRLLKRGDTGACRTGLQAGSNIEPIQIRYVEDLPAELQSVAFEGKLPAFVESQVESGITIAAIIMFAIVFDYARWISNWAVCLFLILHAVKTLPSSKTVPPIMSDNRTGKTFGWIVTLIPRVGVIRPF